MVLYFLYITVEVRKHPSNNLNLKTAPFCGLVLIYELCRMLHIHVKLRNKTCVPVFYRSNKIWVQGLVRMNYITSAPERVY